MKAHSEYMHNANSVCKKTYGFLYGIGKKSKVEAIWYHYLKNGVATRVHGNAKWLPSKSLSYDDITSIVKFLNNFAEQNTILLPGHIPSYKRDDLKLLPSSMSKKVIQ